MPTQDQILEQTIRDFMSNPMNSGLDPNDLRFAPHIQSDIGQRLQREQQFEDARAQFAPLLPQNQLPFTERYAGVFRDQFTGYFGASSFASFASGVGSYQQATNAGQFVTPEQQNTAAVSTFAPGGAGLAGLAIGAAFGPVGAVAGSVVGTGVGQGISGFVGAANEREQSGRLSAESLSAVLSSATESISKFRDALDNAGVPIQQLAQGLQTLSNVSPGITTASVASAGRAASALGSFYTQDTATIGGFLSSHPITYGAREQYAQNQGGFTPAALRDVAGIALFEGDMGTYNAARRDATLQAHPEAARLQEALSTPAGQLEYDLRHLSWSRLWRNINSPNGGTTAAEDAQARAGRTLSSDSSDADNSYQGIFAGQAEVAFGERQAISAGSRYNVALASGASTSVVAGIVNDNLATSTRSVTGADAALMASLTARIASIDARLKTDTAGSPDYLRDETLRSQAQGLYNTTFAGQQQSQATFQSAIGDTTRYGVSNTTAAYDARTARLRYSGASAETLAGVFGEEASYLAGQADRGRNLTPAQRSAFTQESRDINYQRTVIDPYGQQESRIQTGVAQANMLVSSAQSFGDPGQVFTAQTAEIQKQVQLQQQLSTEIRNGNLTMDDRLTKQRQLADISGQIVQNQAAAQYGLTVGTEGIQSAGIAGATALLPRELRLGGDRAFDQSILTGLTGKYQTALESAQNAPNATERAAQSQIAQETLAQLRTMTDTARSYIPTAAVSTQLGNDVTAYNVARELPYLGGQASNPYTRGGRVITDLTSQITGAEQKLASLGSSATDIDRQNTAMFVNPLIEERAGLLRQRYTAAEMSLVQMHEGESPGSRVAASGLQARAAYYNPNTWLSGAFSFTRPDNAYGFSSIGGNSSQGFLNSAHSGGSDSGPSILNVLNLIHQVLRTIAGGGSVQAQLSNPISGINHTLNQRGLSPFGR